MPTSLPYGDQVRANPIRRLLIVSGFAIAILRLAINVLVMLAWGRSPSFYDAAYPLILVLLLRLPEVKEMFSNPARGFSPLLPSDEPIPAESLSVEMPATGGSL